MNNQKDDDIEGLFNSIGLELNKAHDTYKLGWLNEFSDAIQKIKNYADYLERKVSGQVIELRNADKFNREKSKVADNHKEALLKELGI
jgi:hypothetical protein